MILEQNFWLLLLGGTVIFWALPPRLRLGFVAFISALYFVSIDFSSAMYLALWGLFSFVLAQGIAYGRLPRISLSLMIVGILCFLAFFKYVGAFSVLVPLGISYYVFKIIHYAIEISRGNIKDRSLVSYASYLFLFPTISAGPIERYDHYITHRNCSLDLSMISEGLLRIAYGLIKKFVVGTIILELSITLFGPLSEILVSLERMHPMSLWGFMIMTYLYVYMDFSAYSDIAIGGSLLMGIRIMENFNFPVVARNISDFWKRWHMTLARWCQAYVYLPVLGLTRNVYLGVFATFVAMGMWHAGTIGWLLWGCYHATGVSIYLTWLRAKRKFGIRAVSPRLGPVLGIIGTFMFVSASYAFTVIHDRASALEGVRLFGKLLFLNV